MAYLELKDLSFYWPGQQAAVIDIPELTVEKGEHVFLRGASGSGKSTLLGLLAGIHAPRSGTIAVGGANLSAMNSRQRDRFRAAHMGVVFQMFNLLPYLSVLENVSLPCHFSAERRQRLLDDGLSLADEAWRLLERLQFRSEWLGRPVIDLSIGQQQRVAVARALIGRPGLLLADEPTSALDSANRGHFLDLLFAEADAAGSTLLFVSHDDALAARFSRHIELARLNLATSEEVWT